MSYIRSTVLSLALLLGSACTSNAEQSAQIPKRIEKGVFEIPLSLPKTLEPQRSALEGDFLEAQRDLISFAEKHGWQDLCDKPFMARSEVYDKKDDYDKHLRELEPSLFGKPIPKTFVAGVEKEVFFATAPEIYDEVFPQGLEKGSYTKLITHELAHRLHVRLVKGDDEKMGPVWFYEGFAVYAANQFAATAPKLSESEVWDIVAEKQRGSYLTYRAVMLYFLQKHTLEELVAHAGGADFIDWLKRARGE